MESMFIQIGGFASFLTCFFTRIKLNTAIKGAIKKEIVVAMLTSIPKSPVPSNTHVRRNITYLLQQLFYLITTPFSEIKNLYYPEL